MKCMTAPVLAFANFKEGFLLETDASGDGLGAVLLQIQEDGHYHPVAYASRALKGGETRYHSSKLEFLALKWAITDQFREYLQYGPFKVKMDNNPLTYVMTTPNLDAVGHRWVAALANFNFTIEYLRGADNKVADELSRIEERLDSDSVRQLLAHVTHPVKARAEVADPRLAEEHERNEQEIILQVHQLADSRQQMKNLADSHWVIVQQNEPTIKLTYQWLKRPKDDHRTLEQYLQGCVPQQEQRLYATCQKDFVERRGMLYLRTTPSHSQEEVLVFVLPTHKRRAAIDGCHRFASHQGQDRMVSLIKERFWWPSMIQDAMSSVRNCAQCVQFEARVQKPPLCPIICTEPMDLVHIDYIKMEITVGAKEKPVVKDVLMVEDHFTRYIQAYVTKNHTARTTARVLYNEYFSVFGFPRRLMSDQAPEFSGKVIAPLCDLLGVSKVRTSPYHPQSNGAVEHAHQTLRRMIGKMDPEKRGKWPSHLGSVIIAYNATRSLVMGFLPYFLMFGWRPRLPIDLLFPTAMQQESSRTVNEYALSLYERLKEALPLARDSAKLEAQRQKRHYDRRAGAVELQPGDKVLIKLDAF